MTHFGAALFGELLKSRRSKVPLITGIGFSLAPLVGGFFMIIAKDPERAREMGLLGAKAQVIMGGADWITYFMFLAQATAVGGMLLFGLVMSWIFGREYSDRTADNWLALPTPRWAVVSAKFVVVTTWSFVLSLWIYLLGLVIGAAVGLDGWSAQAAIGGALSLFITAVLTVLSITPVAFVASAGKGYMAPMGFLILILVFAQVLGALGWGWLFPWSVGALYAGISGAANGQLVAASYWIVVVTGIVGMALTFSWWTLADQKSG